MKKKVYRIVILVGLFLAIFSLKLFAAENFTEDRITNFNIEMRINEDNSANITESFVVNVTDVTREYKIERSFPIEYAGHKIDLELGEVYDNEQLISANLIRKNRNMILKLNKDELDVGIHKFIITYEVYDIIDFDADKNNLNWYLFGDAWLLPIADCSIKISFPEGTFISSDNIKVFSIINEFKQESNVVVSRISNENTLEISRDKLVYPGEELLIEVSFDKGSISEKSFMTKVQEFVKENLISIFMLIIGMIIFVLERKVIKKKTKEIDIENIFVMNFLIILSILIFSFIATIVMEMGINYGVATNYVLNVFMKFFEIVVVDGFLLFMLYFIFRYEVYKRGILHKILGIFIMFFVLGIGVIYFINYIPDIFYNWFEYLVLFCILIEIIYFVVKMKDINLWNDENNE